MRGKPLAFGKGGTYNPANRERRVCGTAFQSKCLQNVIAGVVSIVWNPFCCSRYPARKHDLPKQDRNARAVPTEGSCCCKCVEEHVFPEKQISHTVQGAMLMKKILLTVVLGVAAAAGAQDAAQPAQSQPAGSQSQAPVIKDQIG